MTQVKSGLWLLLSHYIQKPGDSCMKPMVMGEFRSQRVNCCEHNSFAPEKTLPGNAGVNLGQDIICHLAACLGPGAYILQASMASGFVETLTAFGNWKGFPSHAIIMNYEVEYG